MIAAIARIVPAMCLGISLSAFAQDHQAAPMIGQHVPEARGPSYSQQIAATKLEFQNAYNLQGRPRIAIFWNRKLDDQLSQWYTASRNVDTRDNWFGKGFTASQKRLDVEDRFDGRPQPDELSGFEFGAGYTRTLLNTGVEVVDRDTIMRLMHGKTKEAADSVVVADYQQVEIDALFEYADYIAEVLYAPGDVGGDPLNFMISIKEVKTGRVVTMFRSKTDTLPEVEYAPEWVVGENGYEQIEVPVSDPTNPLTADGITPGTPEHIGWSVAIQTMTALSKHWTS